MVEFELAPALVGGAVATVVMSAMMAMATSAGMTGMPSMPLISGSMITSNRDMAAGIGAVVHYLVMGTLVFGVVYGLLFAAFDNDSWWVGALIGLAHGFVVGLVFMPMMSRMHPRMRRERIAASAFADRRNVAVDADGEVELSAPGMFGKNWGGMTPAGVLMGHLVYGLLLALVYGWVS